MRISPPLFRNKQKNAIIVRVPTANVLITQKLEKLHETEAASGLRSLFDVGNSRQKMRIYEDSEALFL